jgi:hypothetical protein
MFMICSNEAFISDKHLKYMYQDQFLKSAILLVTELQFAIGEPSHQCQQLIQEPNLGIM